MPILNGLAPQRAGKTLRLGDDWERTIQLLPSLNPAAVNYRNPHAILCQIERFPEFTIDHYPETASSSTTN